MTPLNSSWISRRQESSDGSQRKPVAVDLFSGPGGLSLGFQWAGFRVAAAVDQDASAAETYRKNHPETTFLGKNVADVTADEIIAVCGHPDVVIGGPPCRGFSSANTQSRGSHHPGSKASWHFVRLVERISPKAFVMENVTGFMRMDGGTVFDEFMRRFKEVGYHVQILCLNAEDFGVPQKRERIFFVGTRGEYIEDPRRSAATWTVYDAISDLPPLPDGGGGKDEMDYARPALTEYQAWARSDSPKIYNHQTTRSQEYMVERFRYVPQGGNWRDIPEELMSNYADLSNVHSIIYRRLEWNKRALTVTNVRKSVTIHPRDNRILSVREAARLQSLPDKYRFYGAVTAMQQQVADVVPPLLAKAVGEGLYRVLDE